MKALKEKIALPRGESFRVIQWKNNLREVESVGADGKVDLVTGEGTHWHYHSEMELTLFLAGGGTRFVGDHIGAFGAGDLVLLGEGLPHYWNAEGESAGISLQWNFPRGHSFWNFPESQLLNEVFRRAGRGILVTGKTEKNLASRMGEIVNGSGIGRLGMLLGLFGALAEMPTRTMKQLSVKPFSLEVGSSYQRAIGEAMRYLVANFREELRLEELLKITAMSRPTFSRQFRNHTGRSFSEFLLKLRLEAACRELLETKKTVLEISYASGFGQISFFNRSFRKSMGCSPSEFRLRPAG
ncbi:MAG: helix-turn-helix domain-containing protein [Armatimonadetes bacterium]|nr:helix-turn-helix domain-containing protein [Akkermansiaceae bacterium]